MKYHGHEIEKKKIVYYDAGKKVIDYEYAISKNGKGLQTAYSLNSAKEYIDSNYNETYL